MEVKDQCSVHSPFDYLSILDLIHLIEGPSQCVPVKIHLHFPPLPFSFEKYLPYVEENNPILN